MYEEKVIKEQSFIGFVTLRNGGKVEEEYNFSG